MQSKNFTRWQISQDAELRFWQKKYIPPALNQQTYLKKELSHLNLKLSDFKNKTVLEVGCGPKGPINFLPKGRKYGIDPLMNEYKKFNCYQSKEVSYLQRPGEKTGFKGNLFDYVICFNVLDHCNNPSRVLKEAFRILRPGGFLVLEVHIIKKLTTPLKPILNRFDLCHPYHLTLSEARNLILKEGFLIKKDKEVLFLSNRVWIIRIIRKLFWARYFCLAQK